MRWRITMKVCHLLLAVLLIMAGNAIAKENDGGGATKPDLLNSYHIGIEDVLRVVVWNEPDLTVDVAVRPDGRITIPLIDDIDVAGLSPQDVRDIITERLGTFVRDPSVTVVVTEINSFRVFVLGEVNAQGVLNFRRPTRLLQAIATAGGLTPFSKKEALLLREQHGVEKRIQVNLKPLLTGSPEAENLPLRPNDTVIVF
jgi:polysaccharide export outer membrane protein